MKNLFKQTTLMLLLILFSAVSNNILSQEDVQKRNAWFYIQRAHPFDTIPSYGYANAMQQKQQLIQSSGFFLTGPNSPWIEMGPKPLSGIGGIVSGRISALVYDKRDTTGNTVYIAPAGGGVWKTINGGSNWIDISNLNDETSLPTLVSGAIAIDYAHDIIYYGSGTNHYFGTEYMGMGMFKTTNDGQSWIHISNNLPEQTQIFRIAIDPNDRTGSTIYIAEFHGLYKSTDGGSSWTKRLPENQSDLMCTDVCFSPDGNKLYAVGTAPDFWPGSWFNGIGYYRSSDGGANFTQITSSSGFPHSSTPHGRSCLTVSNAADSVVYIYSYDNADSCKLYIYKSTNGGLNFSSYHYPTVNFSDNWKLGGNAGFNQTIRCSDFNSNIVIVGHQNPYLSTNGGTIWTCIGGYCTSHNPHADFHTIDFNPFDQTSNKIFAGHDGGVSKSDNRGSSWTGLNPSLSLSQVWHVGSNTYNSEQLAAGIEDQDLAYKSQGTTWVDNFLYYDGGLVLPSPFKGGCYIGNTCANGTMYYSNNSGVNFSEAHNYSGSVGGWIAVVANHPDLPGTSYLVRCNYEFVNNNHYYSPIYFMKTTDYGVNYNASQVNFTHNFVNVGPNALAISQSNPDFMLMAIGNGNAFWHQYDNAYSRLIKSTDGGNTWNTDAPLLICDNNHGVPNRYLKHIEIDPVDTNEIYITLSGYGSEHVYRTTNGGTNWGDIDGEGNTKLPDNPVSDLLIHYTSSTTKEIIAATDVGVFRTDADSTSWSVLAADLPNSPVNNLDYNRLSGKLNCATYGRSVWQTNFDEPIYVQDRLYITAGVTLNKPIIVANGGKLILGHSLVPIPFTINFTNNANIVVENGGQIIDSGFVAVTLDFHSGTNAGIEINGTGYGTLKNIYFQNVNEAISIDRTLSLPSLEDIEVRGCHFTNNFISVANTIKVNVIDNYFTINNTENVTTAIYLTGSDDINIQNNNIEFTDYDVATSGISAVYNSNFNITEDTVQDAWVGISVSNSSDAFVTYNHVSRVNLSNPVAGMSFDNAYNSEVKYNTISNYIDGFYLYYSSPIMYNNESINTLTIGSPKSMEAVYGSYPMLAPTEVGGIMVWEAGINILKTTNKGDGMFINEGSAYIDNGFNTINGYDYYIYADIISQAATWHIRCNDWLDDPPNTNKFSIRGVGEYFYEPWVPYCDGGGGGAKTDEPIEEPPPPIIVNHGFGIYDTIPVVNKTINQTADRQLLSSASVNILQGSYSNAISTLQQLISNYQDSVTAISAMFKLLQCNDKMHADTSAYSTLRSYYSNLASNNQTDTAFVKAAKEMASKCLVRIGHCPAAIAEYEEVIQSSNDSLEVLCAELNVIETYLIIQQGGDSPGFTGQIAQLKPASMRDGIRMINEKLHRIQTNKVNQQVPLTFKLSQNYPNPFNPLTKIDYAIPNKTNVTLKVYDILGRLVKTLVNEVREPGNYTVTFDGSVYSSGVYFYVIEAGDLKASKKMVLVK